jgi:uncharacterized protein YkwD
MARSRTRLAGITLVLSASLLVGLVQAPAHAVTLGAPGRSDAVARRVTGDAWRLFQLTNDARALRGLPKLLLNPEMSLAARAHSREMASAGELFHTSDVRVYLNGVDWHEWGENVGYTPGTAESLQGAFMASQPHRHNLLNPSFRRVAIGSVRAGGMLWVTLFFYR